MDLGGRTDLPNPTRLECSIPTTQSDLGDKFHSSLQGNSFRSMSAKVPKCMLSGKGCVFAQTARKLA